MSGSINQLIAQGGVQQSPNQNPLAMAGNVVDIARGAQALQQQQFNLQQAQLGPAYQSMRQLLATKGDKASWDDVNAALAQSKRIGGNVDGLVANAADTAANGGSPADFVRATALGGMSPWEQGQLAGPQRASFDTGAGTVYGTTGGLWSGQAGQFTPGGFVAQGLSPGQATEFVTVQGSDGKPYQVPRGTLFGTGVPGGGGGGPAGGGNQVAPAGPPPGSNLQPGQPLSKMDADLATFAQRESGNQNIYSRIPVPGYTPQQTGSGYYQIIPSTWSEGQALAGIPPNQRTATAIEASPQMQYQVAAALYGKYGGQPWARSAPGGAGGGGGGGGPPASGPFIGVTSAQPVAGGGNVQPAGGGMQYFSPTGQPMGQGGGGLQIPGVARTPGGAPVLTPPAPWMGPLWEQSAKQYSGDVDKEGTLAQRIQPWQSAMSILKANPNLSTGPTSQQWNAWASTLQQYGVSLPSMPADSVTAYQELGKNLARGLAASGAASSPTDLARLQTEASMPSTQMTPETIRQLVARQIGFERMQTMRLLYFRSLHPGEDPDQYANQYRSQTNQWASKLDPVAIGADNMTDQDIANYLKGLSPAAQQNFRNSVKEAAKLMPDFAQAGQ